VPSKRDIAKRHGRALRLPVQCVPHAPRFTITASVCAFTASGLKARAGRVKVSAQPASVKPAVPARFSDQPTSRRTLGHYDRHADDFWQGTRDHDVSQNRDAAAAHRGAPPFTLLDFGCGPGGI